MPTNTETKPTAAQYERVIDFLFSKARHSSGCPTYVRKDKACTCGLDEARAIANGEA